MHLHGRTQRSCGMLVSCLCVCELSLFPVVRVNMGRGAHKRDLLQLREEVVGLMHILAHVDATEHYLIRVSGFFSLCPPVTEPHAMPCNMEKHFQNVSTR